MIITLLAFVVALGVLVTVHEWGHLIVAKWVGVKVERFSIGFGPIIARSQRGETEYAISAVPLGGYVKMLGEDDEGDAPDDPRAFGNQALGGRVAIVLAGPLMNLVFALVAYIGLAAAYGVVTPVTDPVIGSVRADSPAAAAGLQPDDHVRAIDGQPLASWSALAATVRESEGRTLTLTVDRAGEAVTLDVAPERGTLTDMFGEETETYLIGVGLATERQALSLPDAVVAGARMTWANTLMVGEGFLRLFTGRAPFRELGGPIAIAQAAGQQVRHGAEAFVGMLAFLSINLGVLNLLPIPVLDGGQLAMFGVEAALRRPLRRRAREAAQGVGLLVLVSLMVFVIINDVTRIIQG